MEMLLKGWNCKGTDFGRTIDNVVLFTVAPEGRQVRRYASATGLDGGYHEHAGTTE
jgi:hypothetical protein